MKNNRRDFIKAGLLGGVAAAAYPAIASANSPPVEDESASDPLNILVLGGTGFLGRCVDRAVVYYNDVDRHDLQNFSDQALDIAGLIQRGDNHGNVRHGSALSVRLSESR